MEYFFALAGLAWLFCGAFVLGFSASTMHEIVACLAVSFGVMFLGLAALLGQLRRLNAAWRPTRLSSGPPPVPNEYAIPIEEAIDDVRTTVRLAERQAWIRSFQAWMPSFNASEYVDDDAPHGISYPPAAQYATGMLPAPLPALAEFTDDGVEYYIEDPRTNY
jgi:hypothetical protein